MSVIFITVSAEWAMQMTWLDKWKPGRGSTGNVNKIHAVSGFYIRYLNIWHYDWTESFASEKNLIRLPNQG